MIITFYSFKGGVGRTLALANIGVILAQDGHRVLLIDFDLEAPGLTRYLESVFGGELQSRAGVLEILERQRDVGDASGRISSFIVPILADGNHGVLHLLTSGRQDDSYPQRILGFDWPRFFELHEGGEFFEECRTLWDKDYDFVLIDSRTGITDSGGVCTIQLPDVLVPVFTASRQSVNGVVDVMRRAQEGRQLLAYDRAPAAVVPLPSRFDSRTEYVLSQQWIETFATNFEEFYQSWLPKHVPIRRALERTKLPYVAYFSFGERLPVFEESGHDPESLGYALRTFADILGNKLQDPSPFLDAEEVQYDPTAPTSIDASSRQSNSLPATAEKVFQQLDFAAQAAARRLILQMVLVGDATASRVWISVSAATRQSADPLSASRALQMLADGNIIAIDNGLATLSNDSLIQSWSRLRGWIESDRDGLKIKQSLSEAANRWVQQGRPENSLYPDGPLSSVRAWTADPANYNDLSTVEREFVAASRALQQRQSSQPARGSRINLIVIISVAITILLLAAVVGVSVVQSNVRPPAVSTLAPNAGTLLVATPSAIESIAFAPGGSLLASGGIDGDCSNLEHQYREPLESDPCVTSHRWTG